MGDDTMKEEYLKSDSENSLYYYCMLVICEQNRIKTNKLNITNGYVVNNSNSYLKELINKSNVIITVGDVGISEYDLSKKYIINVGNENNYRKYTMNTMLSDETEII